MIWITWEKQRRSVELAKALGAKLFILLQHSDDIRPRPLRYLVLGLRTIALLLRQKPHIVFAQNPSIVLALQLCLLKPLLRYRLVVDRHSNFKLDRQTGLKWRVCQAVSRYTVRSADLTIVTNAFLASVVSEMSGSGFVLPDKLPDLPLARYLTLAGEKNFVLICSFDDDEPVLDVVRAFAGLPSEWHLYITGDVNRFPQRSELLTKIPENVGLTAYLEEADYQGLLFSADFVVVLTDQEHTLNCGAYEALAVGTPAIVADTAAIKAVFRQGFIYTRCEPVAIRKAMETAVTKQARLVREIAEFKEEFTQEWNATFGRLRHEVDSLGK
jgi:glycosyltransferase involved in cell wall biosynthesis